jgi:hypothetical protein
MRAQSSNTGMSLIKPRRAHDMITWNQPRAMLISWNSTSQKNGKTEKAGMVGKWLRGVDKNRLCHCCQVRILAGFRQVGEWRVCSPSHFEQEISCRSSRRTCHGNDKRQRQQQTDTLKPYIQLLQLMQNKDIHDAMNRIAAK